MESWEILGAGQPEVAQPIKDWGIYDLFNEFTAFEAAHLWFELEPNPRLGYVPPCHVGKMIKTILGGGKDVFGSAQHHVTIARSKLKELAKELDTKPKFLFPEMREQVKADESNLASGNQPSTTRPTSYLKLIKGLLKKLSINPTDRGIAKKLEGFVSEAGESLGDDKIRDILKEIDDLL
jgi:hypothetical protein